MKVIIDIPEEIYQEAIKSGYSHLYDEDVANAVANGTPLDSIKAEMEKQIERDFDYSKTETLKVPYHYGSAGGLQVAVKMLDNISKDE